MEQRAERRERDRRARALPPPANPIASAVTPVLAAQMAWEAQQRGMQGPPVGPHPAGPTFAAPAAAPLQPAVAGWAPNGQPWPYGQPMPSGRPWTYGQPPMAFPTLPTPPKRRLTRRQTAAALLGSLVGQLLLALATHLLVTAAIVLLLWGIFSEGGTSGLDALEADSLTDVVAFWADPARIPVTTLIVLLVTGAIAAAGCLASFLWHRSVGLAGITPSIALAYATATTISAFVGSAGWPTAFVGGLFVALASSGATLTIGSMWGFLFACLAASIVLTGVVGMLFGWTYLLAFRPRPTWEQVQAEARQAERDAERRAVEADAAELSRVH